MKYLNVPTHARCEELLARLPDNSIDACVTDPPYALSGQPDMVKLLGAWLKNKPYSFGKRGFAGKEWDNYIPGPDIWREVLRVLKPGGYCLAFAGSRTQDLMGLAIRMAGFEIRDTLIWVYGSGFPKSLDLAKAFDKRAGVEPIGEEAPSLGMANNDEWNDLQRRLIMPEATTELAKLWDGWGTQLKPANEPIVVAQKPFEGSYMDAVEQHGTGALNIEASKVGKRFPANVIVECTCEDGPTGGKAGKQFTKNNTGHNRVFKDTGQVERQSSGWSGEEAPTHEDGCPAKIIDDQSNDGAARFFKQVYSAKARTDQRWAWCPSCNMAVLASKHKEHKVVMHPTQKPLGLMRYLVKLVTQRGGVVLDPFGGTFTTAVAAREEGFNFVSCDMEEAHIKIGEARLGAATAVDSTDLQCGAVLCPRCKERGEIKLLPKIMIDRASERGKKVTCSQCLGRFKPEALVSSD